MKKTAIKNNKKLILTIIISSVLCVLLISGVTYAIWQTVATANQRLDVPKEPYNPSEKYIIFRGLDADNKFSDETNKETVAYAAVGYSGLVAEVIIPSTYKPSETAEELPVIKVCSSNIGDDFKYRFNGNPIITSIVIPESVTKISVSACAEMQILEKVVILGDSNLTIGDFAFANCPYLAAFECQRAVIGSPDKYLMGSNQ